MFLNKWPGRRVRIGFRARVRLGAMARLNGMRRGLVCAAAGIPPAWSCAGLSLDRA